VKVYYSLIEYHITCKHNMCKNRNCTILMIATIAKNWTDEQGYTFFTDPVQTLAISGFAGFTNKTKKG